jgi:tetratricopeptide (TPR) repeat protein
MIEEKNKEINESCNLKLQNNGKNIIVAYFLWGVLGKLGIHRLYLNKPISGLTLMALTLGNNIFLFLGSFNYFVSKIVFIWWVVDIYFVQKFVNDHNRSSGTSSLFTNKFDPRSTKIRLLEKEIYDFLKEKKKPCTAEEWNDLGLFFCERGERQKEIFCYRKAIFIDDKFYKAYRNLGFILDCSGNYVESLRCYKMYLNLFKDAPDKNDIKEKIISQEKHVGQHTSLIVTTILMVLNIIIPPLIAVVAMYNNKTYISGGTVLYVMGFLYPCIMIFFIINCWWAYIKKKYSLLSFFLKVVYLFFILYFLLFIQLIR